ncbi:MAG: hypothetical protein JXA24_01025 [Proteobacteria bacterium]|nr:hypothetical protein [Pseudomonadota bacterium]
MNSAVAAAQEHPEDHSEMTRFSDFNAIRSRAGDFGAGAVLPGEATSKGRWVPPSLVDESALTQFRIMRPAEEILPSISSKAMRLSLYRDFAASGRGEMDGIGVSVEWTAAVLIYSAFNAFRQGGRDRDMDVFNGYPRILEYVPSVERERDSTFRIYARTAKTADDIIRSAVLMASHRGYIVGDGSALNHYADLTGIFITKPGVAPKRVGISGYEHWVDFEMEPSVPLLKFASEPAWLIPGPPRLSREETDHAVRAIAGEIERSARFQDAVELVRMFPEVLPPFKIPIDVKDQGRLSEFPPRDLGRSPGSADPGPAFGASAMFSAQSGPFGWRLPVNPWMQGALPVSLLRR